MNVSTRIILVMVSIMVGVAFIMKVLVGKSTTTGRIPLTQEQRREVFRRYNYKCATCPNREGLEIHHRNGNASDNRPSNLVLMCYLCHKRMRVKV